MSYYYVQETSETTPSEPQEINSRPDDITSKLGSLNLNKEKEEKRIIWRTGLVLVYKSREDDVWHEYNMFDDEITQTYREIYRQDDEVVMFDINRKFYIKPKTSFIYSGTSMRKVDHQFGDGEWIEWTGWKQFKKDDFFKRFNEKFWERIVDGVSEGPVYEVTLIEGDKVVLRKDGVNFKLTWRDLSISRDLKWDDWGKYEMACNGCYSSINYIMP